MHRFFALISIAIVASSVSARGGSIMITWSAKDESVFPTDSSPESGQSPAPARRETQSMDYYFSKAGNYGHLFAVKDLPWFGETPALWGCETAVLQFDVPSSLVVASAKLTLMGEAQKCKKYMTLLYDIKPYRVHVEQGSRSAHDPRTYSLYLSFANQSDL